MATFTKAPSMAGLSPAPTATAAASSHGLPVVKLSVRSPFLGKEVGALRMNTVRLAHAERLRCNGLGDGAFGSQMNLFSRFARVIKSYLNAIVSAFEDPEKIIDQAVIEMNEDLTKMRQATARVLASHKQLENKYKATEKAAEDWYKRAQLALSKGDEQLAREALKRRKNFADNAITLKAQLEQQNVLVKDLVSKTKLLESRIQEAKAKKDNLKARAQTARTATKINEMVGKIDTSTAFAAYEKMEEKVLAMEAQAEALNKLTSDDLDGKFAMLESFSVDEDLANLKKDLSGASQKGALPPGRTGAPSARSAAPFLDLEVEKELIELRRKTSDY